MTYLRKDPHALKVTATVDLYNEEGQRLPFVAKSLWLSIPSATFIETRRSLFLNEGFWPTKVGINTTLGPNIFELVEFTHDDAGAITSAIYRCGEMKFCILTACP